MKHTIWNCYRCDAEMVFHDWEIPREALIDKGDDKMVAMCDTCLDELHDGVEA